MFKFHKILIIWYQQNKRPLPWRTKNDPYLVWVSEIILQQTRVDQGTSYYIRFIEKFPNVKSLADASEMEVLRLWQGLGYYTRARNMHFAARQIINEFNGRFPDTLINIAKLPGIGPYTAAAIASISFGLPHAAIDGNVYRVLARIFGIKTPIDSSSGKKEFKLLAEELIDRRNPGLFNEALMEFGALVCTPQKPACSSCPFNNRCIAWQNNEVAGFPVKSKKTLVKNRFFSYLVIHHGDFMHLVRRDDKDIWRNLYQFPLIESQHPLTAPEILSNGEFITMFNGNKLTVGTISQGVIHQLTHQKLHVQFVEITVHKPVTRPGWIVIPANQVYEYPVPKVIDNYLLNRTANLVIE